LFCIQGISDSLFLTLRDQWQCCVNPKKPLVMQTTQWLRIWVLLLLREYRFRVLRLGCFSHTLWPIHPRRTYPFWFDWKRSFSFSSFFGLICVYIWLYWSGCHWFLSPGTPTKNSSFLLLSLANRRVDLIIKRNYFYY